MRDYMSIIEEFTDTDVQTLAALLNDPATVNRWRRFPSRAAGEKATYAHELAAGLAELMPRQYRCRSGLPVHYARLLEVAADLLCIDMSFAAAPSVDELGRQVATKVAGSILKSAPPEQVDRFMEELDVEARKLGACLDDAGATGTDGNALELGPVSGHSTYVLASSLTATSANALGISLPCMAYTALSSSLAALLGPVGWAAAGIAGLAGLRAARGRIDARQRLRFLAVVTYLIAVGHRVRENIRQEIAAVPGSEEAIAKLQVDIDEMWSVVEGLEGEVDNKALEAEAQDARNAVLEGKIGELEEQLEIARQRKGYAYPVEEERVVPIGSQGNHKGIWKGPVRSIGDVPQPDRRIFQQLMRHVGVQRIQLGSYNGANPQPRRPPVIMLRQSGDGLLVGRLYTKARRANSCEVSVIVEKGSESSVLHYATEEGLMRSKRG